MCMSYMTIMQGVSKARFVFPKDKQGFSAATLVGLRYVRIYYKGSC